MLYLFFALLAFAADKPIRIQLPVEPSTLDPRQVEDVYGFNIAANVNEGLVRLDGAGKLVNALAESYRVLHGGKEYRFRIRKDAKWSDGVTVTADDFVRGLERARDPKTIARDSVFLASVREVKNESGELVLRLREPDPALLQALTMPMASPARAGEWRAVSPSTGPYQITFAKTDREIRLEANPHYGKKVLPVTFKVVSEENTALNLFETHELDLISSIAPTELDRLGKAGVLSVSPSASAFYLMLNPHKAPFTEARWRKALAGAVSRENLVRLSPQTLKPAWNYLPSALSGSGAALRPDFSAEVMWAKAQRTPELSLVHPATAMSSLLAQRLQSDVERALGFRFRLEPMEWKAFVGRLQAEAPALYYFGYGAPFDDPESHLKLFLAHEPDNRAHYENPAYDALVTQTKRAVGKMRADLLRRAQELLLVRDVVVIPLVERTQVHAVAKDVHGFRVNPYGIMDLRELSR